MTPSSQRPRFLSTGYLPASVFVLAAVFAVLVTAAGAQAQSVRATIDRAEATIQDQLGLRVTVEGSQNAQPQLPDLSVFQVHRAGQQSQVNMINGKTSVSVIHNYILVPRKTGTFTIGPVRATINGRTYQSKPFQVRILSATATARQSESIFVTAQVSNKNPYIGEQVIYTWRFYRRVQVADAQIDQLTFEGFLAEDLGDVKEYRTSRNGQEFLVSEIKKALFPQEEGTITIAPSQLRCQVVVRNRSARRRSLIDQFFDSRSTEAKVLRSDPIEIIVRPLPAAPRGYSGLVGSFKLDGRISKRALQVGESATWKLTVSGTGNVQMIGEPKLPDLSRFKIYDDKPSSSVSRKGAGLTGSKTFTKALVPLESGELLLPAVQLTYFDPKQGTYRTASTAAVNLDVAPADDKEELRLTESVAPTTGKVSVRILADDILPIYKDFDAVRRAPFGHRADVVWLGGLSTPALLFFALFVFERRRRHFEVNVDLVRRKSALRKALKGLDEVAVAAREGRHDEAAQTASRLLREYVGDKVALEGSAFTSAEADSQLRRCGVDDEVVAETRRRLETLETAQYGGMEASETEHLAAELGPLLKQLERQIRV